MGAVATIITLGLASMDVNVDGVCSARDEQTGEEMSLPARQQRVLDQIEMILQARDPHLTSLFAIFARLTSHDEMPKVEELKGRLARLLRPAMLIPVVVVVIVSSVVLGSFVPSTRCSTGRVASGTAYVVAGKQGICNPGAAVRTESQVGR